MAYKGKVLRYSKDLGFKLWLKASGGFSTCGKELAYGDVISIDGKKYVINRGVHYNKNGKVMLGFYYKAIDNNYHSISMDERFKYRVQLLGNCFTDVDYEYLSKHCEED